METSNFTREDLAQYILHTAQDSVIEKIKSFLFKEKEEIVSYTIQGEPLTKEKYIQQVQEAEERIEKGQFTTHEDLIKESKNW